MTIEKSTCCISQSVEATLVLYVSTQRLRVDWILSPTTVREITSIHMYIILARLTLPPAPRRYSNGFKRWFVVPNPVDFQAEPDLKIDTL
jgi:hypothetical protein